MRGPPTSRPGSGSEALPKGSSARRGGPRPSRTARGQRAARGGPTEGARVSGPPRDEGGVGASRRREGRAGAGRAPTSPPPAGSARSRCPARTGGGSAQLRSAAAAAMEAFCGSRFWDANLSIHTDSPDLTPCFQNTILAWIPSIYLWTALPFYLLYLKRSKRGYIVLTMLSRFKTLFGVLLWCVSWADLFYSFHELLQSRTPPPVYFVTPLVIGITVLLATLLIQYERLRGVQSSGVLIIFWFLSVLCAVAPFRSKIMTTTAQVTCHPC